MAGTDELMARLQQLEDGYYGDKRAEREKTFFDKYGGRFSNDRGLGLAILNELDARGIDTSAADEAVQQILDQLRTECQQITDLIKNVQDAAIETEKKVDVIEDVVQDHVGENPDASVDTKPEDLGAPAPDVGGMPPESGDMGGTPPEGAPAPDMGGMPSEGAPAPDMGGTPPEGAPAPDMGEMPPEGGDMSGAPAEEPVPPNQIPSDERIKNIKAAYGRIKARRASERNSFKPSAGILSAAQGGH